MKALHAAKKRYQDAPTSILAVAAKVQLVNVTLEQLQVLLIRCEDLADASGNAPIELITVLETTLQGCMVVYSCLDAEVVVKLSRSYSTGVISWNERFGLLWNEDKFKELEDSLHGVQHMISGVLSGLQM